MRLVIDIGNTRIKAAVFEQDTMVYHSVFSKEAWQRNIESILMQHPKCTDLVVASVAKTSEETFTFLEGRLKIHLISRQTNFPFENLYQSPNTLGIDRMVLASGAVLQYPNQARLVIDAGTCITYDFINEQDEYLGGAISPGIRLRYQAMHQFTAKLPLLSASVPESMIGKTTEQSMHVGVVGGITKEIDGFISQYQANHPKIIIILTGGDAEFLAKQLKNTIFAHSNFLLESLNKTFQYAIKND